MKIFKSILSLFLIGLPHISTATELSYEHAQRVFEADLWNEVHGRTYPYKIDKNVVITGSELKGNELTHYMTFYERNMDFNIDHWKEGAAAMTVDNFCKKPYIKNFPVIFRLKVTVRKDERSNPKDLETIVVTTKEVCFN